MRHAGGGCQDATAERPVAKALGTRCPMYMPDKIALIRHVHPANHHAHMGKASLCDMAKRYPAADLVGIEEHGDFAGQAPPGFAKACGAHAQILTGAESFARIGRANATATTIQHVGVLGPDTSAGRRVAQGAKVADMSASVHRAGGAAIFNHPEWPGSETHPETALSYTIPSADARAFDAVEIFNDRGVTPTGNNPEAALGWVERNFFSRGIATALVSGADDHGNSELARTPTYTLAIGDGHGTLQEQVVRAIRGHATYVSKDPAVNVLADDIDGAIALGASGVSPPALAHTAHLALDHLPQGGRAVVVYDGKEVVSESYQGTAWSARYDFVLPSARTTAYVYAKVYDADKRLCVVTSPTWLTTP